MSSLADINKRDKNDRTPLYCAAKGGNFAEVKRLLALGADPNALSNDLPANNRTPLHVAANLDVVRLLVEHGADIDATDDNGCARMILSLFRLFDCVDLSFLFLRVRYTPLVNHCFTGSLSCVEFLCFKGANVNHQDIYRYFCHLFYY